MTYNKAGLGSVGSYQVSGKPFLSGGVNPPSDGSAALKIEFPSITRWILINAHDVTQELSVKVAFSQNGFSTNNYMTIHGDYNKYPFTMPVLEMKVSEIYLSGTVTDVDVVAGLTGISNSEILNNWSGSAGVG
tara:strand:+ start:114 stop:512 length:399 start_codon:yes stop_codon:yes gene_type:complete